MKSSVIVFSAIFFLSGFNNIPIEAQTQSIRLQGAWETSISQDKAAMICSEKFFSVAIYEQGSQKFIGTYGGAYRLEGDKFIALIEFHSLNPEMVGKELRSEIQSKKGVISFNPAFENESIAWKRIDSGKPGKLAGAWLITGRMQEGEMSQMTPGARRTMKILSGTRFQWIAYNVETRAFSGTGGGTYTTTDGKYTEKIEFFSRDNSRVGQSLVFDFSIEDGHWRHKGLSSKGDPIDEVWTKREKTGI